MTQKTAGNHHYPGLDPASPKYRDLVENLVAEYRPLAKTLCQAVLRTLNKSEGSLQGQSDKILTCYWILNPVQTMRAMNLHSFIWCWPNSRRHPVS